MRTLMRSWSLGVSLGAGGIAAKLEAEPKTDPLPALHRLLELPRETYERTGQRVLVAFDEFHEVPPAAPLAAPTTAPTRTHTPRTNHLRKHI